MSLDSALVLAIQVVAITFLCLGFVIGFVALSLAAAYKICYKDKHYKTGIALLIMWAFVGLVILTTAGIYIHKLNPHQ